MGLISSEIFLKFPERETYTLIQSKYDDDKFALANEAGDGDDANRYKIGEFSGSDTQSPEVVAMLNTFQTVINTGATATDVVAGSVDVPRYADAVSEAFYADRAREGGNGHSHNDRLLPITFPLPADNADKIKGHLVASKVGVEGRGDVSDLGIRKSKECPLSPDEDGCAVKVPLPILSFDFPEARAMIREAFCGQADYDIVYKPYKFVMYTRGDFFMPHADSMSDARQIGSLAVQVPVGDVCDGNNGNCTGAEVADDAEEAKAKEETASYVGDGSVGNVLMRGEDDYGDVAISDEDHCDDDNDDVVTHAGNKSNRSGHIVFYLGRQLGQKRFRNSDAKYSIGCGRPRTSHEENKLTVDLTSHLRQPPHVAAKGAYRVKYAAWLGDIVHEVTRVSSAFRCVLLFRLYRVRKPAAASVSIAAAEGIKAILGPLASQYLTRAGGLAEAAAAGSSSSSESFGHMLSCPRGLAENDARSVAIGGSLDVIMNAIKGGAANGALYLGVMLRHAYPPAGLVREGLKGADAALFAIASRKYTVTLHTVFDFRTQVADNTFIMAYRDHMSMKKGIFAPTVYLTSDNGKAALDVMDFDDEEHVNVMRRVYPYFTNGLWAQQGFGEYLGGGHVLGNCDCGSDWWYRGAVMIIQPLPSKMSRRMPMFLLGLRGPETFRRLMGVPDVFTHILSFI